ncbi:MAG: PhzF family phenazine biosynthesis protein [Mariniblastus sp.]
MRTYIVDSFTDQPFKGNPAGVCLLETGLSEKNMQSIATELNFSETAFVAPLENKHHYSIQYFSPIMEIPLCGHATLAASKVLLANEPSIESIKFTTGEPLDLYISKEPGDERIVMNFPLYDVETYSVPDALIDAIGVSEVKNCAYNRQTEIVLLEIESTDELADLNPDFAALLSSHQGIHGVVVTACDIESDFDFHSRFFWPWSGGEEDPVTGGTHTFLAKYWGKRLDKKTMRAFQSSKRTGSMDLEITEEGKLLIKAHAVILLEGTWKGELA